MAPVFKRLKEDIDNIVTKDPAARGFWEVLFCYPGLHAVLIHRLSHWLWRHGAYFLARFLSNLGRMLTGVDIHPGAVVGHRLFIDHATGVVIGETAEIGDEVTIYHGVTLGGISLDVGKRHPTLEHGVIVGSGAQVLGPITVGAGARIGANAVVLQDVPVGATMIGIPAKEAIRHRLCDAEENFQAYAVDNAAPDPVGQDLQDVHGQIADMAARLASLESRLEGEGKAAAPRKRKAGANGKRPQIGA